MTKNQKTALLTNNETHYLIITPPSDSLELEKHDWLLVQPEQDVLPKKKMK